jgi:hypothetical protein
MVGHAHLFRIAWCAYQHGFLYYHDAKAHLFHAIKHDRTLLARKSRTTHMAKQRMPVQSLCMQRAVHRWGFSNGPIRS